MNLTFYLGLLGGNLCSSLYAEEISPVSHRQDQAGSETDRTVISVTASRVASEVQQAPVAITLIDQEELERVKPVDSRSELMRRIPGYSMIRNLRIPIGGKNYTINLIDGLAIGSAFGSGTIGSVEDSNTFDIERVEVIRGPASALYGSNALGGVINVITREPPADPEYRVWGEAGEYDRQRGGVSAAGSNDTLGYFLDVNFLDYEGWQERTNNERKQFSSKLLYTPDIDVVYTFRVEYLDRYQENPGSLTQAQYVEDWQQSLVYDAYNDEESVSGAFKYERDLSSHSGIEFSYGIRNNLTEGPPSYSATGGFSSSDVTNQNLVGLYRQDFDWHASQFIVGIDLLHSDSLSKGYTERDASSDIRQKWDITAVTRSPFIQYEFSPKSWLHLSLGGRFDRIEYGAKGYQVSRGTTTNYDESITFSHFSPKAGASFDLNPRNSLWFGYGQGFVVPSSTYLFVGSRGYDSNPDLDPEKAGNYELGLRGKTQEGWLSYDIALYHTKITDMLVADDNRSLYVNAGEVLVKGMESSIGIVPQRDWRIDLTHTYADNQYIDFVSGTSDYSGNTLSASPKQHIDARVIWMPLQGLSAELEWNHISSYYTSDDNDDPQGRARRPDLLNLRVAYAKGPWSFWGHILNLADRKYAERVSYKVGEGRSYVVGGPRTIYMGIAYNG
jgi:outer membrane receptor protein involved in Fe transport